MTAPLYRLAEEESSGDELEYSYRLSYRPHADVNQIELPGCHEELGNLLLSIVDRQTVEPAGEIAELKVDEHAPEWAALTQQAQRFTWSLVATDSNNQQASYTPTPKHIAKFIACLRAFPNFEDNSAIMLQALTALLQPAPKRTHNEINIFSNNRDETGDVRPPKRSALN